MKILITGNMGYIGLVVIKRLRQSYWEGEPLIQLAAMGQMMAFEHDDFWHPMDTLRDKNRLEELWSSGNAPWKAWQ